MQGHWTRCQRHIHTQPRRRRHNPHRHHSISPPGRPPDDYDSPPLGDAPPQVFHVPGGTGTTEAPDDWRKKIQVQV